MNSKSNEQYEMHDIHRAIASSQDYTISNKVSAFYSVSHFLGAVCLVMTAFGFRGMFSSSMWVMCSLADNLSTVSALMFTA